MKDFSDLFNSDISDELLAAYIDGNTIESENQLIESTLNNDSMLSEAYEIANDGISFGEQSDWDIYDGDYGFLEMGLPPVIDALDMVTQNQNYDLDFGNNSDLFGSDDNLASNDPYSENETMGFGDTMMSSEMDDSSW